MKARGLAVRTRIGLLVAVAAFAIVVVFASPRFGQDPAFHDFADQRAFWGIPNFADVISNATFLVIGLLGLGMLSAKRRSPAFGHPAEVLPYAAFFLALVLTAAGSAVYHLKPNNETLFWDRLALTSISMALLAAFVVDRIHRRIGLFVLLPGLLLLGSASVIHWQATELLGRGDLRFYGLMQVLPVFLIPMICLLFPGRLTSGRTVVYLFVFYGLARLCEVLDRPIYQMLGGALSGHTLKHLLAALASLAVLDMLRRALQR